MILTMVGEHDSGKTTYLGALWTVLKGAELGAPVSLQDGKRPPNSADLDELSHSLLACEQVGRTQYGSAKSVDLDLMIDGTSLVLKHLDVSGETYERAMEQRLAPQPLLRALAETDALMLFVNPGATRQHQTIAEAYRALEAATGQMPAMSAATEQIPEGGIDPTLVWKLAPTSVHLVELLQIVLEHRDAAKKMRIAVVVSAWDTLDSGPDWGQTYEPAEWLRRELPLLSQFLDANTGTFDWIAFGVSAQGCDFRDAKAVDLIVDRPYSERTVVTTGPGFWTTDIAEPLRWFLALEPGSLS